MRRFSFLRHLALVSLLVLLAFSGRAALAARAGASAALQAAPEWGRLARLWQTMIDHSSDAIYDPAGFRGLSKSLDALDADLAALVKRGLLPADVPPELTGLFRSRFEYISDRHYTSASQVTLSATESAVATSHWIIELQLAMMRSAGSASDVERKAIAQSESPIVYEISFLDEYERFVGETEKRRRALADRQAAGENVDFKPFENERQRRENLLLAAYHARRVPISKSARALMPYIQSLTTTAPSTRISSPPPPGV
jgi:hypothetical protein